MFALQFFYGGIQHRAIRRKADRRDIAVLRRAKQISRPADFQIPHRNFESGTQIRKFPNRIQAFLRRFRQHFPAAIEEIRARDFIRAPHAPAHLIELRKSHAVRVVDNHRIGIRLIDPVFHNRRTKQHVVFPAEKIVHDPLQRVPRHPSVRDANRHLRRQQRPQMIGHRLDCLDAIENEIDLSAAFLFAQNRFLHDCIIIFRHIRLNGVAIRRRLRQRRHVTQPRQTHVERPRNRRRRQRQDIDPRLARFPFLFLRHAETLLFIHDQQSQMPALDLFRQNRVRPNQDIDIPQRKIIQNILFLFGRCETIQTADRDAEMLHTLGKRLKMLHGEHRRRRQHHRLVAAHHAFEDGAHRDFRFPESHVAAEQHLHRLRPLHRRFDFRHGAQLVLRFHIRKRIFKFHLLFRVRRERDSLCNLPFRINLQKLPRHFFDGFFRAALDFIPLHAAHF